MLHSSVIRFYNANIKTCHVSTCGFIHDPNYIPSSRDRAPRSVSQCITPPGSYLRVDGR
jgi:hypothetical protein